MYVYKNMYVVYINILTNIINIFYIKIFIIFIFQYYYIIFYFYIWMVIIKL